MNPPDRSTSTWRSAERIGNYPGQLVQSSFRVPFREWFTRIDVQASTRHNPPGFMGSDCMVCIIVKHCDCRAATFLLCRRLVIANSLQSITWPTPMILRSFYWIESSWLRTVGVQVFLISHWNNLRILTNLHNKFWYCTNYNPNL